MNDLHTTPSFKALDEGRLQPVDKGVVVTPEAMAAAIEAERGVIFAARSIANRDCGGSQTEMREAREAYMIDAFAKFEREVIARHQSGRTGAGEALRDAARLVFEAWDAHVVAVERMNAAIPDILTATRAEREVYDERYRASEEAKREWYRAMHRFIETPGLRQALKDTPVE